jgi:hypothetical protein
MQRIILIMTMVTLALPAQAHSPDELEAYREEWINQVREHGFTWELVTEYLDMMERHPWYAQHQVETKRTSKRTVRPGVEQWRNLVSTYFPTSQVETALCIMGHESGGDPSAKNPRSSARGLFQILASLWAPYFGVSYEDLYDPGINTRLAANIWSQQGWGAWSPWSRGLCR